MEKNEQETHDFMNVESFSQLPFIRPKSHAPIPIPIKEKANILRLFGKEFGAAADLPANYTADHDQNNNEDTTTTTTTKENEINNDSRRFECHYCCRNFPTSQALGGHQNAHKRERQHAKRAHHLHTASASATLSDAPHIYGLVNYNRLAGSSSTPPYPSWNNNRFYGYNHSTSFSQAQPINGSPLGLWRNNIPAASTNTQTNFNHHHHHDLLNHYPGSVVVGTTASTSQSHRYVYQSNPTLQDHVSLDLHL